MYVPEHYAVSEDEAWSVVERAGAGSLVLAGAAGLRSVFAPVLVSEDQLRLRAHVARANPWWSDARDGDEVLALFRLADAYVSPGLYPTKAEQPAVAPTWDYVVVEVAGRVTVHDDAAWVERLVRELTDRFESPRDEPWRVDDAPPAYVAALVRAIVGVEIEVTSVTGAAKLSQNKGAVDRRGVRDALAAGDARERAVATLMDPPG
jgi:transcriptional regulator